MTHEFESCVGCGAVVPKIEGPIHRYMTAAPGCWAHFGEVIAALATPHGAQLARQYSVDAYAVQHPGTPGPQATQSVAVHLMSLYAYLERGRPVAEATGLLQSAASVKGVYHWLTPPSFVGRRTVLNVQVADAEDPLAVTKAWAESAWEAWGSHHQQVAAWFDQHARR